MNIKKILLTTLTLAALIIAPSFASAATAKVKQSASFDEASLTSTSTRPTISGEAENLKSVRINIYKEGDKKVLYKSKAIKVVDGEWKTKLTKTIPKGTYDIKVYGPKGVSKNTLATEKLVIGTGKKISVPTVATTLVVESLPLLTGGTARQDATVPVSYLQVTNIGKEAATVKGFWVKQNGTAQIATVVGFSVVDDAGVLRGSIHGGKGTTLFKDAKDKTAFVPVQDVVIPAGQLKLFTIKADTIENDISAHVGTTLMIDVTGIDTNAKTRAQFPIRGTTWTLAR